MYIPREVYERRLAQARREGAVEALEEAEGQPQHMIHRWIAARLRELKGE